MFKAIDDLMNKPSSYEEMKTDVKEEISNIKEEIKEEISNIKEEIKEEIKEVLEKVEEKEKRTLSDILLSFFLNYLGCSNKRADVINPINTVAPVELKVEVEEPKV
jgi:predicted  nucleic acid-binding Zn-ribbon protein